ncbi:MAG: 50S ribosomal protein L30e [Methanosarcinales archaeon Met12]|nr:MAG: 50S ribosomal protein L30e [Methanosarcinales archaeon Met12]
MKIDLNRALRSAIKTGEVIIGANRTIDAAKNGKAQLIILASNSPREVRMKIEESEVPVLNYAGKSVDLGLACGKPYIISALAIINPGESDIILAYNS